MSIFTAPTFGKYYLCIYWAWRKLEKRKSGDRPASPHRPKPAAETRPQRARFAISASGGRARGERPSGRPAAAQRTFLPGAHRRNQSLAKSRAVPASVPFASLAVWAASAGMGRFSRCAGRATRCFARAQRRRRRLRSRKGTRTPGRSSGRVYARYRRRVASAQGPPSTLHSFRPSKAAKSPIERRRAPPGPQLWARCSVSTVFARNTGKNGESGEIVTAFTFLHDPRKPCLSQVWTPRLVCQN